MAKTKTNLVCLDAQFYIWAIKGESSPSQTDMIARAKNFLKYLLDQGKQIVMPTPLITELTRPCTLQETKNLVQHFEQNFIIKPYDTIAATTCSEMIRGNVSVAAQEEIPKRRLKYDCLIAAVAVVSNCDTLYSHDEGMRKFCNGFIDAQDIPTVDVQTQLFE